MGRRNEHSREQQRDMAIAAAELILVREGFAGLSMRKVADAIGYTVGQLYLIFQNQDDLLAIINERTTDAIYGHLRDCTELVEEPLARLRALAAAYIEFAQKHPHRFRMLFEHQLPAAMQPRASSELRIKRMFELVESAVASLMPAAQDQRLRRVATTLWSGVHGIAALAVSGKFKWAGDSDYGHYSDELVDTFVAGLRAPDPRGGKGRSGRRPSAA